MRRGRKLGRVAAGTEQNRHPRDRAGEATGTYGRLAAATLGYPPVAPCRPLGKVRGARNCAV
jgi:hypothetical protein